MEEKFIMEGRIIIDQSSLRQHLAMQRKLRRQIQIRNQILIFLVVTFLIFFIIFLSDSIFSRASNMEEHQIYYKYFKSIEVQQGDTLWDIAKDCKGESQLEIKRLVTEIKQMNQLSGNQIVAGQHLMVPYYSTDFK